MTLSKTQRGAHQPGKNNSAGSPFPLSSKAILIPPLFVLNILGRWDHHGVPFFAANSASGARPLLRVPECAKTIAVTSAFSCARRRLRPISEA